MGVSHTRVCGGSTAKVVPFPVFPCDALRLLPSPSSPPLHQQKLENESNFHFSFLSTNNIRYFFLLCAGFKFVSSDFPEVPRSSRSQLVVLPIIMCSYQPPVCEVVEEYPMDQQDLEDQAGQVDPPGLAGQGDEQGQAGQVDLPGLAGQGDEQGQAGQVDPPGLAGQGDEQGLAGQAGRVEILRGSREESHQGIPGQPNTLPIIAELIQVVHPGQEYRHRGRNIWLDYAEGPAETMDSRVHAFLERFELFFDMRGAPRELTETATGQTRELIFMNGVEVPYFALRVFNEAYCRVLRWEMEARARAAAHIAAVEARSAKDEGFEEQELSTGGSEEGEGAER